MNVPTLEHAGLLEDLPHIPAYLLPEGQAPGPNLPYSCSFCGVGDSGLMQPDVVAAPAADGAVRTQALLRVQVNGMTVERQAVLEPDGRLEVATDTVLAASGAVLSGELLLPTGAQPISARECGRRQSDSGLLLSQTFQRYQQAAAVTERKLKNTVPTTGCVKLKVSMMRQRSAFPIHAAPSALEPGSLQRVPLSYSQAIARFADLLLAHRGRAGRTLIYACGQLDYFAIFAIQEVFRLLGVRNLTGNAEHCLNAGAVHNEMLTGQEGPFLTTEQGIVGPDRFYLFNGWNGLVTHPPVFRAIAKREDLDAYLIEVVVTESAQELAKKLGPERVLLIRPRGDPHLALAVAHELLTCHPQAVERRFLTHFADPGSWARFVELAQSPRFAPARVAERIAPEEKYVERLLKGICSIAHRLADPRCVPINIPSVGLSQSSGVVAHALWGCVLAMLGKYGLRPDGTPAGGTLRVPGQINAETEVQGLSRKYFMGRIQMDNAADAARRMGLPDDAYAAVLGDQPRTALDYAEPTPDMPELFVFFGTQFEANMIERPRWIRKLHDPNVRMVVIDPIPDPFSVAHADLIIPAPPHPATSKLYQNGEWKLSLSAPHKRAPAETRSDATLIYDVMADIAQRLETEPALAAAHPDLAPHSRSGYLRTRFADGLQRLEGEASRPQLWQRVLDYMDGGSGPLYCRPAHADGRPIAWRELVEQGAVMYGGVGVNRYVLDYAQPERKPYADIYGRPRAFTFFVPTEDDLRIPQGIILNTGRSSLSDDAKRIRFASTTFNSGKATPIADMPDEHPVHIAPALAQRHGLKDGDWVRITGRYTGSSLELPVTISERVKGETIYVSFHKSRAQIEQGRYINDVTSSHERCPYCAQTSVKSNQVFLERIATRATATPGVVSAIPAPGIAPTMPPAPVPAASRIDTRLLDPAADLPVWNGQGTALYVADIIHETHDVFTFRLQGDPLCRFVYRTGQFCSVVLNIDGKKVVRSYSISSTPTRPYILEITVKRVPGGLVSNWLPDHLKVGDRIEISGPKGKFCLVPGKISPKLLFIGAGSGITPVMSMARWLCDVSADVDVRLFNSVRTPDDVIFHKELELLGGRHKKIFSSVILTDTRGTRGDWTGLTGRINRAMLEMAAPDLMERQVYMCGPQGFMDAAQVLLAEMGFNLAHLHSESFGGVRTSVADKAAPLASGHAPDEAEAAPSPGRFAIEFARSGKLVRSNGDQPLLDIAEAEDINLDYGCRTGSCGDCKLRVLKGEVAMDCDEGLSPADKTAGFVLSCVARPRGDCTLDA